MRGSCQPRSSCPHGSVLYGASSPLSDVMDRPLDLGVRSRRPRVDTLVRGRWLAVVGQTSAVLATYIVLGFPMPFTPVRPRRRALDLGQPRPSPALPAQRPARRSSGRLPDGLRPPAAFPAPVPDRRAGEPVRHAVPGTADDRGGVAVGALHHGAHAPRGGMRHHPHLLPSPPAVVPGGNVPPAAFLPGRRVGRHRAGRELRRRLRLAHRRGSAPPRRRAGRHGTGPGAGAAPDAARRPRRRRRPRTRHPLSPPSSSWPRTCRSSSRAMAPRART